MTNDRAVVTATPRVDLRIAAAFCGVVGLYDTLYVGLIFAGGPLIGPLNETLFPDFAVFYAGARAFFEGKVALVYDTDAFTRYQTELMAELRALEVRFRPFLYPPTWLLLVLPLGLLTMKGAAALFLALTAAAATLAAGWRRPLAWLAVLTSPAAVWVVLAGQNTFLSLALLYGGMRLLERSPLTAGILLGLLSYKPQVWILVPFALLAARQWWTLAAMAATIAVLVLASAVLFGSGIWWAFIDASRMAASPQAANEMFEQMYMHMTTLLAAARIVGLPPGVAGMIQLAGAALAVAAVWIAFRRHPSGEARTAVLIVATFLVSPYTLNYDLLLLMPAAVALFRRGAQAGFYPLERLLYVVLWLMPTFGMILNRLDLPIMPVVILLFGVVAWARLQAQSKVELPSAAAAG
jgi:hypothetical protein